MPEAAIPGMRRRLGARHPRCPDCRRRTPAFPRSPNAISPSFASSVRFFPTDQEFRHGSLPCTMRAAASGAIPPGLTPGWGIGIPRPAQGFQRGLQSPSPCARSSAMPGRCRSSAAPSEVFADRREAPAGMIGQGGVQVGDHVGKLAARGLVVHVLRPPVSRQDGFAGGCRSRRCVRRRSWDCLG